MTSNFAGRALRVFNTLAALVLIAVASGLYWYVLRPLPQRSGSVAAPVGEATVSFDTLGVPHIRAATIDDALFVQGYVTAQDRLWQMDGLRRFSGGDLAEILGPAGLDSDKESRRLRLRRIAEDAYPRLPEGDRAAFAAYTRGVNHYISTHLNSLPIEFTLLNYQPRPWSVVDSLLLCLHMFRTLTTTWRDEVAKRNMLAEGEAAKVNFLWPVRSGYDPAPGSNAWAIAGTHTASGKPLLSNDMHLEYSLPGIWYMVHLNAPGLEVSGVALPGAPGVIVGHNRRIAWGITNLQFDVQDLYFEKFDDRTGRYEFRGQIEQARLERELIRVKGQATTEFPVWVTRHGPLLSAEPSEHISLRWVAAEPGMVQFPILDINRAGNWKEFTTALARWPGPGSNFAYADVDGNIGYHVAGRLPARKGYNGDVPVDGSSGNFEWDGFIPFEQLPSAYNPPSGLIVTANQDPFPADYPHPVNGNFAPPHRARQIRDRLSAREGWRAADLLSVQTDVYSGFSRMLAGQVVAAYTNRNAHNPSLEPIIEMLKSWDGQMEKDLAAPFVITLVYQHLRTAIAERAAPGKGPSYEFTMAPAAIERLLRERPPDWFSSFDEVLLRALADAVEEGSRIQGRDSRRWKYGSYLRVNIQNPVIQRVPMITAFQKMFFFGPYFGLRPQPMNGSTTTPKQTTLRLAPSMRLNADLANWDNSLLNIVTGQSGQVLSRHYTDQWRDYYAGRSYPMQFDKVDAKSTLVFRP